MKEQYGILQMPVYAKAWENINMIPTIDFDTTDMVDIPVSSSDNEQGRAGNRSNPFFNPFETQNTYNPNSSGSNYSPSNSRRESSYTPTSTPKNWEQLYNDFESEKGSMPFETEGESHKDYEENYIESEPVQQTFMSKGMSGRNILRCFMLSI